MRLLPADRLTIDELTLVYNESRSDYIVPMPMSAERLSEYMRLYDVDLRASWVVADDESYIGLGMLGVRDDRAWITRIGVVPRGRRRGAGSAITEALMNAAFDRDLSTIWLEVIVGNRPAYRMFLKNGFQYTRELVVGRRAPRLGPNASPQPHTRHVQHVGKGVALRLLEEREERPNWLNETESMQNVHDLRGLVVEFDDNRAGWVTFRADRLMLTHVYTGVTRGDQQQVSQMLLDLLHSQYRRLDAYVENLPADEPMWSGFERAGYFDTFRRNEMVLRV
jgi:ribosomal protein S18 acetylase RimI-like enzyme